jgi:hypothetical protein
LVFKSCYRTILRRYNNYYYKKEQKYSLNNYQIALGK